MNHRYAQAVEHFRRSKNHEMTAQSLAMVGDFDGLDGLVGTLPEHDPTLLQIGAKFEAFGRSQSAVGAYAKAGAVRRLAALQLLRCVHSLTGTLQLIRSNWYSPTDTPSILSPCLHFTPSHESRSSVQSTRASS